MYIEPLVYSFLSVDIHPPPPRLSFISTSSLLVLHNTMSSANTCTTGIDLLSRRPTHPYSWPKGMGSLNILGVALWRNAHCDLVTWSYHWFLPGFSLLHTYPLLALQCLQPLAPQDFLTRHSIAFCRSINTTYSPVFPYVSPYVAAPRILHPPSLYLAWNHIVRP